MRSISIFAAIGIVLLTLLATGCTDYDQPDPQVMVSQTYQDSVLAFRDQKDRSFANPTSSPFEEINRQAFNGLHYFPFRKGYVVPAVVTRLENASPFVMETTGPKQPRYVKYAQLDFTLHGVEETLTVYRNLELAGSEQYKNHLFVPFTDQTSGESTYGGGRYLDLQKPLGDTLRIDFNKAYNPFCVYNFTRYDCPIPPVENRLSIPIKAGEKDYALVNEVR
jgi:uncharacterized protein (DUF1684 family)